MLNCICGVREPARKRLPTTPHDKAYLRERYPRREVNLPAYVREIKGRIKGRYTLGEGKHGKVKAASRLHDGLEVAIKSQPKSQWLVAKGETELARSLQLDHVVRVLDWAEGPKKSYIVMEQGEAVHTDHATPATARAILWDIIAGLREIHARGIYHRDIGVYWREGKKDKDGATLQNIMLVKGMSHVDDGDGDGDGDGQAVYKMTDLGKMACSPPAALRAVYARADARGLCLVMHAFLLACDPDEAAPFLRWYRSKRHLRVEDVAAHPWLRGEKHTLNGSRIAALAYPLHVLTEWTTSEALLLTGRGQPSREGAAEPS